jgi:hypothetical protein
MAIIVLNVSAQFATAWGESTIRTVFAMNAAGWGSHSQESPASKFHYYLYQDHQRSFGFAFLLWYPIWS